MGGHDTHKDRIQFQAGGAPVPLSVKTIQQRNIVRLLQDLQVMVKTSLAERNP